MPYLNDPRGRVTLNLPAAEFAVLTADAARAGYGSPGTYALALVRARGAALRPVVDERGAQRVAQMQGKFAVLREAHTQAEARAAAAEARVRALELALAQRPTRAEYDAMLTAAVAEAVAGGAIATLPTAGTQQRQSRPKG